MNTKVKGDKIKEGSIPLSALSSDMNIPSYIDFVKKLSNDDINTTLNIPYVNKVVLVRYNDTRILNGGESTTYSNYGMTFTFTASQVGSDLELHIEGNGSLDVFDIKVYKGINKIKKEFLPDDMGGADWNAKQGEPGYIENKPFDYLNTDFTEFRYDGSTGMINAGYLKNYYYGNIVIYIKQANEFIHYKLSEIYGVENQKRLFGPLYVYVDDTDYNLKIYTEDAYTPFDMIFSSYTGIKKINDMFLDDTVLKTTPQTLSNDAKNQALANLGIKTIVAKQYGTISPELLNNNDELVYNNPNYYIFKEDEKNMAIVEVGYSHLKIYDGRFVRVVDVGGRHEWQLDED